jgi:hypothetical protein
LLATTVAALVSGGSGCGPAAMPPPAYVAPAPAPLPPPAAPDELRHAATQLGFPPLLGTMIRGELTDFERRAAGLGISVTYRASTRAWATIYVYTMGLPAVPDDLGSAPVDQELRRCVREVIQTGAKGSYQDLRLARPEVTALGSRPDSPRALAVGFSFVLQGEPLLSRLYLTTWRNHFIKIRFSYPAAAREASERALQGLLEDLGLRLRRPGGTSI